MRLTSLALALLLAGSLTYWFALREPAEDAAGLPAADANAVAAATTVTAASSTGARMANQ